MSAPSAPPTLLDAFSQDGTAPMPSVADLVAGSTREEIRAAREKAAQLQAEFKRRVHDASVRFTATGARLPPGEFVVAQRVRDWYTRFGAALQAALGVHRDRAKVDNVAAWNARTRNHRFVAAAARLLPAETIAQIWEEAYRDETTR